MAYNYEYPHFEAPQYNMDWILETIKRIEEQVLGLDNYNYEGENKILDLNDLKPNSMASFTENFNVLNAPLSGVRRFVFTNGSDTGGFQRCYDLQNLETYERVFTIVNGLTTFSPWEKTQNAPGLDIHNMNRFEKGSVNDLPINTVVLVYNTSAVTDGATNNTAHVMTFKSPNDGSIIQVWFDLGNFFIYLRSCLDGKWTAWVESNHIDLTPYIKAVPYMKSGDNINTLEKNRTTLATQEVANIPSYADFNILTIAPSDTNDQFQIAFQRNENEIWLRTGNNDSWTNVIRNYKVLHRTIYTNNLNSVVAGNFYSGRITTPLDGYYYIQGVGFDNESTDQYQIILSSTNTLCTRFRNNANWGALAIYQKVTSTRSITITSTAEEHSTDDEGRDRYMMGDNIYTEAANTMYNTYISLPGQSLLHSDEGKQSFKEAILSADLSDTDVIMTNLEMWDMNIPLDTIAEEVAALSDAITAKNPMCELTLLSIPPIDIPLWGDELLDYTMPNGSTLRQVDDRLFRLSEDHAFKYVSFEYFYDAQNANLMEYLGDDFKTNKQYLRRVGSFLKSRIM